MVLGHMDCVKKCTKKIHASAVELGEFDIMSVQADSIYFYLCALLPVPLETRKF